MRVGLQPLCAKLRACARARGRGDQDSSRDRGDRVGPSAGRTPQSRPRTRRRAGRSTRATPRRREVRERGWVGRPHSSTATDARDRGRFEPPPPSGIWLSAESVQTPIETLVIDMLASNLPSRVLREAELEELRRGAKLADVALEYLGLRTISVDGDGEIPLRVVASHSPRESWRQALALPEGDRPIGILINTADAGPLVLVHEVFDSFAEPEKELVRRYAALAVRGEPHEAIVAALRAGNVGEAGFTQALVAVRRAVRSLDPTVLFSPDGATRVQLGSLSRTTKDILREGLQGDH